MSQRSAFIFENSAENSADPDEMPHYAAFIICHIIWVCTVCKSTHLQVSGIPIDRHPCDPFSPFKNQSQLQQATNFAKSFPILEKNKI